MEYPFGLEPAFNDNERELATLDDGWARAALAFRTAERFGHRGNIRLMSLNAVYAQLEARRERYYKGNTMELLYAVQLCAEENTPLPKWLAIAFDDAFSGFLKNGASLDKVFYSPELAITKKRSATARRNWTKGLDLWAAVRDIAPQHTGLDGALKLLLQNSQFNWFSLTEAKELVNRIDVNQHELTEGRSVLLSQIFKKKRKQAISP